MVLSKLIEENGPDFLSDLLRGDTVDIVYIKDGSEIAVKWPSVAAKAISTRFKGLHQYGRYQTYTVFDCLGTSQAKFEAKMLRSKVSDLMDHFGHWLYTGNIDIGGFKVWDLWTFGETFGAPRYQNDVMKALCGEGLDSNPSFLITEYFGFDSGTLKKCWEQANFTADAAHKCFLELGTVYWGNKQMLKFVMDVIVFVGLKDSKVRRIIHDGGYVAEHIVKLLLEAARSKTSTAAPWKSGNVKKYLVNEVIILEDSSSKEETEDHSNEDAENGKEDGDDDDEDNEEMNDEFETEEESTFTAEELLAEGYRLAQPRHV
ncbi:hypothetical protein OCU04_009647 [Sclerotinia nivalis]|uniref:Uncharacterized protein n=1 Tax=Sclerotinia nivalis TaxID=352851 RepID=A0A9X0AFJ5_9HELO|nr:hypothetical protein OCU04_009647 [Sclerotinia nivalis]